MKRQLWILCLLILSLTIIGGPRMSWAQATSMDEGHCTKSGRTILACWNFQAGKDMPKRYGDYEEYLPNLEGWDFRVNLPHIRFQYARAGAGSPGILAGVVEESDPVPTLRNGQYGHRNNALWLFRVQASDGKIYGKEIPSRRSSASLVKGQNIRTLQGNWLPLTQGGPQKFSLEQPQVAVIGNGLGQTRIIVVARGEDRQLYMTQNRIDNTNNTSWGNGWVPLGITTSRSAALTPAFNGKVALATWSGTQASQIEVRLYDPATNQWSSPVSVGLAASFRPRLVWDGTALNVFYIRNFRLYHSIAVQANPLTFGPSQVVSNQILVEMDHFDVMPFNQRFHVVIRKKQSGQVDPVWSIASFTPFGQQSKWAPPSFVGFSTKRPPKIVSFYEHVVVVGVNAQGQVVYARKDPNQPGNNVTRKNGSDVWVDKGFRVDPRMTGAFSGISVLAFNNDLYLVANKQTSSKGSQGIYMVNASRSIMKRLLTKTLGTQLIWGKAGGSKFKFGKSSKFGTSGDIPGIGDVNCDGRDDLIRFTQPRPSKGNMRGQPGNVFVSLGNNKGGFGREQYWKSKFSRKGEIPMVGDFNGDCYADIINFTQKLGRGAKGRPIGAAIVNVALNQESRIKGRKVRRFGPVQVWQTSFSKPGEIPAVGDFNGDQVDDVVTFSQKTTRDRSGKLIGHAVVTVALSNKTRFGIGRIWQRDFSRKGAIPMVGDFDGDQKDDIINFTQRGWQHVPTGRSGKAGVRVAISTGSKFGPGLIWHGNFSFKGEVPQVGDFNLDGKADIVTFRAGTGNTKQKHSVFVAHSLGNRFDRSYTWMSDFGGSQYVRRGPSGQVFSPQVGKMRTRQTLNYPDAPGGTVTEVPRVFAFTRDGSVRAATAMGSVPFPSGAPWERYKWFTEKGMGAAAYPSWLYERGPNHCISVKHRFGLRGASGVGGPNEFYSSVRGGGRAGHVVEELGHSIFANCFRPDKDPFKLLDSMFATTVNSGGFGAGLIANRCQGDSTRDFYDCRTADNPSSKKEHIFLGLLIAYRLNGDGFRERIQTETDPIYRKQLKAAYAWLKRNWFYGSEFQRGPGLNASLPQEGVQCYPGDCKVSSSAKLRVTRPIFMGTHQHKH